MGSYEAGDLDRSEAEQFFERVADSLTNYSAMREASVDADVLYARIRPALEELHRRGGWGSLFPFPMGPQALVGLYDELLDPDRMDEITTENLRELLGRDPYADQ